MTDQQDMFPGKNGNGVHAPPSHLASPEEYLRDMAANTLALHEQTMAMRTAIWGRYGLQYDGRRDLIRTLGYIDNPNFQDFWGYSLRGLGARIVEVFPKDTWAIPPTVQENDEPGVTTAFEEDWEALVKAHDIWGQFYSLDVLAQIGEYAVMLYGLEGVDDYEVPASAQVRATGPESVRYVRTYRQNRADIMGWGEDPYDAMYGQPQLYRLRTQQTAPRGTTIDHTFFVHPSHCLHFADNLRENRVLGAPILFRVLDALFDLAKQNGGISEMVWRDGKRRIVAAHREGVRSADVTDETKKKVQAFAHDFTDFLGVEGLDISTIDGVIPNNEGNMLRLMQIIAGILDYPMRRLFGSEQGQLATEQDNRVANAKIVARYERVVVPRIIRPFIDRMIEYGVLRPPQQDYDVIVPDLLALSPTEQAEVDRKYVQNIRDFVGAMGEPEMIVTREEFRTRGLSEWKLSPEPEGGFIEPDEPDDAPMDDDDMARNQIPGALPGEFPDDTRHRLALEASMKANRR